MAETFAQTEAEDLKRIRRMKADAWDEGYERGADVANGDSDDTTNPYRKGATE